LTSRAINAAILFQYDHTAINSTLLFCPRERCRAHCPSNAPCHIAEELGVLGNDACLHFQNCDALLEYRELLKKLLLVQFRPGDVDPVLVVGISDWFIVGFFRLGCCNRITSNDQTLVVGTASMDLVSRI
jgi:hypothetical protein